MLERLLYRHPQPRVKHEQSTHQIEGCKHNRMSARIRICSRERTFRRGRGARIAKIGRRVALHRKNVRERLRLNMSTRGQPSTQSTRTLGEHISRSSSSDGVPIVRVICR